MAPTNETPLEKAHRISEELRQDPLYTISRGYRRKERKRIERWQNTYSNICTEFITRMLTTSTKWESPEAIRLYDLYESKWKTFCRFEIGRNSSPVLDTSEKKKAFLNRFGEFVSRYLEKVKKDEKLKEVEVNEPQEVKAMSKEETNAVERVTLYNVPRSVEEAREALKKAGYKTAAKTQKGLQRFIDKQGLTTAL